MSLSPQLLRPPTLDDYQYQGWTIKTAKVGLEPLVKETVSQIFTLRAHPIFDICDLVLRSNLLKFRF